MTTRRAAAGGPAGAYEPVRLTRRCNQRCRFCSVPLDSVPEPSLQDVVEGLRGAGPGRSVELSGGEPTLREDLPDLVEALASAGIRSVLQTNALRCSYPAYARRLAAAGLRETLVSLHAATPGLHDRLVRRPGAFRLAVAGARNLVEAGVTVGFNVVLTRETLREGPRLARRLPELVAPGVELTLSCVTPYHAAWEGGRRIIPPYDEVVPWLRRAVTAAAKSGVRILVPDVCGPPTCRLRGLEEHSQRLRALEEGTWIPHPDKVHGPPCAGCDERSAGRCDGAWRPYAALFAWKRLADPRGWIRHRRARSPRAPETGRNFDLNLGMACDGRCAFCVSGLLPAPQKRFASAKALREEMERARAAGHDRIVLLGGEPLRHPAIVELVAHARRIGFTRVGLATNGMRLSDRGFAAALLDAGVTRLGISFHTPVEALEDALVGRKGAFRAKVAAVRNVVELSGGSLPDGLAANPVLMRPNLRRIERHARFLAGLGLRDVRFNLIRPEGRARERTDLVPSPKSVVRAALRAADAFLAGRLRGVETLTFGSVPPCWWPPEIRRDAARMRVLCGDARDLRTEVTVVDPSGGRADRFRWETRQRDVLRRPVAACGSCAAREACGGPWTGYVELFGERDYVPLTEGSWSG